LKKGFGKYKNNLPFKCFNCGRVGHFSVKCSHKTNNEQDFGFKRNKHYRMNNKNDEKIKHYKKKKKMNANDETISSDEYDNNSKDVLFMAMNDQYELSNNEGINHEDSDDEGEINIEGELICALQ